jgi:uncharacterized protein (DUF1800 family)
MSYESNAEALYQQVHALRDHLEAYRIENELAVVAFSKMLAAVSAEFALHEYLQIQQAITEKSSKIIKPDLQS